VTAEEHLVPEVLSFGPMPVAPVAVPGVSGTM
jgi:hypothetical protein